MKIESIGPVLCGRELTLRDGHPVGVIMGMPQRFPDGHDDYFCPFQIIGIGNDKVRYGVGVDAVQAVWLTLQMIGARLHTSSEAKSGALSWLGQSNLGFPVPDSISDFLPKGE
jgi:hypothetical protein